MLTKEQEKRIESLYIEYQEDIKPLTFLNWLIGFVIGVVASIIATWIWENFIHI